VAIDIQVTQQKPGRRSRQILGWCEGEAHLDAGQPYDVILLILLTNTSNVRAKIWFVDALHQPVAVIHAPQNRFVRFVNHKITRPRIPPDGVREVLFVRATKHIYNR
jgi:hypothetical protein